MGDWAEEAAHQILDELVQLTIDRAQEAAKAAEEARNQAGK